MMQIETTSSLRGASWCLFFKIFSTVFVAIDNSSSVTLREHLSLSAEECCSKKYLLYPLSVIEHVSP